MKACLQRICSKRFRLCMVPQNPLAVLWRDGAASDQLGSGGAPHGPDSDIAVLRVIP